MEERLQKLLSAAGVCSRRTAEGYITAGRVTVNGLPASLGQRADPERDKICVDGRRLGSRAAPVYLMLNKPQGYVTTLSDEKGRRAAADLVKDCGGRAAVCPDGSGGRAHSSCPGVGAEDRGKDGGAVRHGSRGKEPAGPADVRRLRTVGPAAAPGAGAYPGAGNTSKRGVAVLNGRGDSGAETAVDKTDR